MTKQGLLEVGDCFVLLCNYVRSLGTVGIVEYNFDSYLVSVRWADGTRNLISRNATSHKKHFGPRAALVPIKEFLKQMKDDAL